MSFGPGLSVAGPIDDEYLRKRQQVSHLRRPIRHSSGLPDYEMDAKCGHTNESGANGTQHTPAASPTWPRSPYELDGNLWLMLEGRQQPLAFLHPPTHRQGPPRPVPLPRKPSKTRYSPYLGLTTSNKPHVPAAGDQSCQRADILNGTIPNSVSSIRCKSNEIQPLRS